MCLISLRQKHISDMIFTVYFTSLFIDLPMEPA